MADPIRVKVELTYEPLEFVAGARYEYRINNRNITDEDIQADLVVDFTNSPFDLNTISWASYRSGVLEEFVGPGHPDHGPTIERSGPWPTGVPGYVEVIAYVSADIANRPNGSFTVVANLTVEGYGSYSVAGQQLCWGAPTYNYSLTAADAFHGALEDLITPEELTDHLNNGGTISDLFAASPGTDDQTAVEVSFNNVASGLLASDVQAAIDEVAALPHTGIAGINLLPTATPNEFSVEITWVDENGVTQTTTDATPVTITPRVATATSADIGTPAPADILTGVDPATGDHFYVDASGDWQAVVAPSAINTVVRTKEFPDYDGLETEIASSTFVTGIDLTNQDIVDLEFVFRDVNSSQSKWPSATIRLEDDRIDGRHYFFHTFDNDYVNISITDHVTGTILMTDVGRNMRLISIGFLGWKTIA